MRAETTLPPRIQTLIETIEAADELTPAKTGKILAEAEVKISDLEPWADFDHPVEDSYGRKLVHDGGSFELMVMSWVPGDMAAIHDHGHTQWGAVRLFGDAEHAVFRVKGDRLITADRRVFPAGSTVNVGHDLIHQMGNTGDEPFLSLHLYGCDGRDGDITSEARLYELDEEVIQRVNGGVFFALPEDEVVRQEEAPTPDYTTQLRHRADLLRRLARVSGSLDDPSAVTPREQELIEHLFDSSAAEESADAPTILDEPSNAVSAQEAIHADLASVEELRKELLHAGLLEGLDDSSRSTETSELSAMAAGVDLSSSTPN